MDEWRDDYPGGWGETPDEGPWYAEELPEPTWEPPKEPAADPVEAKAKELAINETLQDLAEYDHEATMARDGDLPEERRGWIERLPKAPIPGTEETILNDQSHRLETPTEREAFDRQGNETLEVLREDRESLERTQVERRLARELADDPSWVERLPENLKSKPLDIEKVEVPVLFGPGLRPTRRVEFAPEVVSVWNEQLGNELFTIMDNVGYLAALARLDADMLNGKIDSTTRDDLRVRLRNRLPAA